MRSGPRWHGGFKRLTDERRLRQRHGTLTRLWRAGQELRARSRALLEQGERAVHQALDAAEQALAAAERARQLGAGETPEE